MLHIPLGAILLVFSSAFVHASPIYPQRPLINSDLSFATDREQVPLVFPRLVRRANPLASFYSSLVVFGASYNDNAHTRAAQYSSSLRNYYPYAQYGGRYTNGPVAVEYMTNPQTTPTLRRNGSASIALFDYAFGGSVIKNGLTGTNSSSPDTQAQVAQYLAELASNKINVGKGRVLHVINTGINPLTSIWNQVLSANLTNSSVTEATRSVTLNVQALGSYISSINGNPAIVNKTYGVDYLIANIPPLELVPTFGYQIPSSFNTNQRESALSILKQLSAQFNTELASFASSFARQTRTYRSKVMYYDLATLWKDFYASPASYGVTVKPITTPCYNSTTGSVCTNPSSFLYFDTLHPVTTIHKVWASKMIALVNAS